ncbi:MAG: molybdopterin-dependent oxidoreductase [Bryobacteraceae bacterium]
MIRRAITRSSMATLAGLAVHYAVFFWSGIPLWTETIAEWIMARTPSRWAVPILESLGEWAKPFAVTGGLAVLGFGLFFPALLGLTRWRRWWWAAAGLVVVGWSFVFDYRSAVGQASFWIPALTVVAMLSRPARGPATDLGRRGVLAASLPVVMTAGTAAVAVESWVRNRALAKSAVEPVALFPFQPPAETFAPTLVRRAVTPVDQFYGMSKNTVDPAIHPAVWKLRITVDGRPIREIRYTELLAVPRVERYVTLRCVSNTLKSDLMGTALWSGVHLAQLVDRRQLPSGIVEVAVIGVEGHGDSLSPDYAFSDEVLFALGMNGKTLSRAHGFPLRLLTPRYYGFKNVKWMGEIAFLTRPYLGTWPKMGYTKEPLIHTASHIDRYQRDNGVVRLGGVSFAGVRGIRAVRLRGGKGEWKDALLEKPLSPYTWTRWQGEVPDLGASEVEARALDGTGRWQEAEEGPLFPNGMTGPTIRRIS